LLDPIKDMGVSLSLYPNLESLLARRDELNARLTGSSSMRAIASNTQLLSLYETKQRLLQEATELRTAAQSLQSVTMREELKKMKRVLRKLDFVSPTGVLSLKGRFACEVSAGDEVLLTNLVFVGAFNELSVDQTVALLSCFVGAEASGSASAGEDVSASISKIARTDMHRPFRALQAQAREVAKVCIEQKLFTEEDEYVRAFDPAMIDVAYAWSNGAKFSEICKITEIFEGSIIRSLRRLEELLRQLASASVAIGNQELVNLFTEGAQKIRRGVVFAASLYI
jgi:ATP-dependent RNA helicase DOB1